MHAYKQHLEYLCDLVERFMAVKRVPCRVDGGTIGPDRVQLFLSPGPHVWKKQVYQVIPSLALYLGMNDMRRGDDGVLVMDIPFQGMMAAWDDRPLLPRREAEAKNVLSGGEVWEA